MSKRQKNTLKNGPIDLNKYFCEPESSKQRQYEAVRAFVVDGLSAERIAARYGYKASTVYALVKNAKSGKLDLFPQGPQKGPKRRRVSPVTEKKIIEYRKLDWSASDIESQLRKDGVSLSSRTIERILKEAGFGKLKRRNHRQLGVTKKNKSIPERSENLNFKSLEPFSADCPVAGLFFFIPYIIESGVTDIIQKCQLPESSVIGSLQACLSMMALKLMGNERLSHMEAYDHEPGLGLFAGLNVLPKSTYMKTYSCLASEEMVSHFQERAVRRFSQVYPDFYQSRFINLDFHSIPHYGDEETMEKIWCGARGKTLRGANTVFAQDGQSDAIIYTRSDILRKEESAEIQKFIDYWKKINGDVRETLVFDCKFTKYKILDQMSQDNIKFVTLRKRYEKLIRDALNIPKEKWKKIRLDIPKRKHKNISVYEEVITLKDCQNSFRQVIAKDHGRETPTFIITNNFELSLSEILLIYAKRWHIENKLAELVAFFNLNALSSPIMTRIHFDIFWTMIADTLYHRFAIDLRRFENNEAPTVFKRFINVPGKVVFDGAKFQIRIRKRGFTPILKNVKKLQKPFRVPWLNNLPMEIIWTT